MLTLRRIAFVLSHGTTQCVLITLGIGCAFGFAVLAMAVAP